LLIVGLTSVLFCFLSNKTAGISAFIGGLIGVLSNTLFAAVFLCARKVYVKPNRVLSKFYFAEMMKLIFTIVLFALIMQNGHLAIFPLLFTYLIGYITFSFMGLFFIR
jgi:F0F1-type ATP synthase assembly protein I